MNETNHTYKSGNLSNATALNTVSQTTGLPLWWIVIILLTGACGAATNFLLLIAVTIYGPLRKCSSYALIIHCILIDLYVSAVTVPTVFIPSYLGPSYPLPRNFCRNLGIFVYNALPASMYATSVLAVQRLIATVLPYQYRTFTTQRRTIACLVLFPWLCAVLLALFPALEMGMQVIRSSENGGCLLVPTTPNSYPLIVHTVFSTYVPTGVTGMCYLAILVKAYLDARHRKTNRFLRRRLEISRTLCFSFLWHCAAIYPFSIVMAFFSNTYTTNFALRLGLKWLKWSFTTFNPVFVWASSMLFQDGIKKVLRCRWLTCKRHTQFVRPSCIQLKPPPHIDRHTSIDAT